MSVWVGALLAALGAGAGALTRYVLGGLVTRSFPGRLPAGILFVNAAGGFLAGWLSSWVLAESPFLNALLLTGFCGGLTTFSTVTYETAARLTTGGYAEAWANLLWNTFLTVGAAALGAYLACRRA